MKGSSRSNRTGYDRPNYRILFNPKNTGMLLKDLKWAGYLIIFACFKDYSGCNEENGLVMEQGKVLEEWT